jgi:PAS domain S-box-containing protein
VGDDDFEKGVEAGASDYVKKPFDRGELRLRVRNLIHSHESDRRYQALFKGASQGILAIAVDTQEIVMANPSICEMLGYTKSDLVGMHLSDIHPREELVRIQEEFNLHTKRERVLTYDIPFQKKDGSLLPADISSTVLSIDGALCAIGFLTDATRRHELEKRLREEEEQHRFFEAELRSAQKLEAVGRLASGIAHEINTPIQFIGDNLRFLKDSFGTAVELARQYFGFVESAENGALSEDRIAKSKKALEDADIGYLEEEIPVAVDQSLEGIERIVSIVRAMKEFAHPGSKEKAPTNINKLVETTVTVSKNEWKYAADMKLALDSSLPQVPCIAGEISQVLLNLIVNASHAVEEKSGQTGNSNKGLIAISTTSRDSFVEIRISDTGGGIPMAIRDKIWEPFFTTKEAGKGTGQGLAIARACIVEKHGGTIHFETEEGVGTIFVIRIPIGTN